MSEVQLKINDNKGAFYIEVEGKQEAMMTFVYAGEDIIIIDHTSVAEELRGQNVGKQLLQKLVELAREENKKVVPLCPFAKKEMMRNKEEYADILHE